MNNIIPSQLMDQRFIRVDNEKRPFEKGWQQNNNYSYDDAEFNTWLNANKRYGVLCGVNNLVVIDFDDEEVQNAVLELNILPKTFAVKTARKGLLHLYYYCDDAESWKVLDKEKNTIADIQGRGKQVVGPGTIISDGRRYSVVHDGAIASIPMSLIHKALDRYDASKNLEALQSTLSEINKQQRIEDKALIEIKRLLRITDILHDAGISTSKNPTKCPFHDSKGGKCFGFDQNKNIYHCFHCEKKGDAINLWMQIHHVEDFVEAKKKLCEEFNVEDTYAAQLNDVVRKVDLSKGYHDLMVEQYMLVVAQRKFSQDIITTVAKVLVNEFHFVTVKETDVIFSYHPSEGIYKSDGEVVVKTELEKYFDNKCKTDAVNEVVNKIKRLTYNTIDLFTKSDLKKVCLLNGVYDLEKFELVPFSHNYHFINRFPLRFDAGRDCPRIKKFLSEIVPAENVKTLRELFGWILMPDYRIQRAVMLIGFGRNGKSVYLHTLKSFLGPENVSSQSLQRLSDDKFATFALFAKLANVYSDLSSEEIKDTSAFKTLTSGMDPVDAEQKFKDKFNFVNRAKLLFSCNQIPRTNDISDAFFRRWVIITFPYKFEGASENKNLAVELTTPEELSGLFNLAVEEYKDLMAYGDFTTKQSTDDVREIYTRLSDPIGSFILDKVAVEPESHLIKEEVYAVFLNYCKEHKFPAMSEKMFSGTMFKKLPVSHFRDTIRNPDGTTSRPMCWRGIGWKAVEEGVLVDEESI